MPKKPGLSIDQHREVGEKLVAGRAVCGEARDLARVPVRVESQHRGQVLVVVSERDLRVVVGLARNESPDE